MQLYYKVRIEIWSYDWEDVECHYCKTREDAEEIKKERLERIANKNKKDI